MAEDILQISKYSKGVPLILAIADLFKLVLKKVPTDNVLEPVKLRIN